MVKLTIFLLFPEAHIIKKLYKFVSGEAVVDFFQ